eukprot:COSAG02_NODE_2388_length_8979_cov_6.381081_2_plen_370_part_00
MSRRAVSVESSSVPRDSEVAEEDSALVRTNTKRGNRFRPHRKGDGFAWRLLLPCCYRWDKQDGQDGEWKLVGRCHTDDMLGQLGDVDGTEAPMKEASRSAIQSQLGAMLTINALVLGFCTSMAFGVGHGSVKDYAPVFAVSRLCCTDVDDSGLCVNGTLIDLATTQISQQLMEDALMCQTTSIVVTVIGASMLYSLSSGVFAAAEDNVLGEWASTFSAPMKLLVVCFLLGLRAFIRVIYRIVAIKFPHCDKFYNPERCGRLAFRYKTWALMFSVVLAIWMMHVRVTAQMRNHATGAAYKWCLVWLMLTIVMYTLHYLNEVYLHMFDRMNLHLYGTEADFTQWQCLYGETHVDEVLDYLPAGLITGNLTG